MQIITIPQDNWYEKSFNVLVPLSIQGQPCRVLKAAERATFKQGTQSAVVLVNGKVYGVPGWAIVEPPKPVVLNYSI
jgi:hypothetical protein